MLEMRIIDFPLLSLQVNYLVLDWIQKLVVDDEAKRQPLPGKNEMVTKKQFINYLKLVNGYL